MINSLGELLRFVEVLIIWDFGLFFVFLCGVSGGWWCGLFLCGVYVADGGTSIRELVIILDERVSVYFLGVRPMG
jgi:hypothetical protein